MGKGKGGRIGGRIGGKRRVADKGEDWVWEEKMGRVQEARYGEGDRRKRDAEQEKGEEEARGRARFPISGSEIQWLKLFAHQLLNLLLMEKIFQHDLSRFAPVTFLSTNHLARFSPLY